jgi:hypothetical protein
LNFLLNDPRVKDIIVMGQSLALRRRLGEGSLGLEAMELNAPGGQFNLQKGLVP